MKRSVRFEIQDEWDRFDRADATLPVTNGGNVGLTVHRRNP